MEWIDLGSILGPRAATREVPKLWDIMRQPEDSHSAETLLFLPQSPSRAKRLRELERRHPV